MSTRRILLALLAITTACASTSTPHHAVARTGYDALTSSELITVAGTTQNAYSAVERLRPLFLATRAGVGTVRATSPQIYVFINGSFAGDVDVLKTLPLATIESIRRVQATAAFTQYGEIRSGDGVIMVRLRR